MAPIVTRNGAEGNTAWSGASALQLRESCPHKRPPDDVSSTPTAIPACLSLRPCAFAFTHSRPPIPSFPHPITSYPPPPVIPA